MFFKKSIFLLLIERGIKKIRVLHSLILWSSKIFTEFLLIIRYGLTFLSMQNKKNKPDGLLFLTLAQVPFTLYRKIQAFHLTNLEGFLFLRLILRKLLLVKLSLFNLFRNAAIWATVELDDMMCLTGIK